MIVSPFTLHYICLTCRRAIKSVVRQPQIACSICHGEMLCMGRDFTAPRKKDDAQWRKIEWMLRNGWQPSRWAPRFSCPIRPEMTLRQTEELLMANAQAKSKLDSKTKKTLLFPNVGALLNITFLTPKLRKSASKLT